MGLWQRIASAFRRKGSIEEWFESFGSTSRSRSGLYINQTTAMRLTAVMDCVRIRSEDIAKLPVRIYRVTGKGRRKEAKEHPLYQIFRKPNSWQTWFEFCEMMQAALDLRGNAYAVVISDGRGRPLQMIPVNPDRVIIYEAPDGQVFYAITRMGLHETAVLKEFDLFIPAGEVFHLRWMPGTVSSLYGISPIAYAREAIGYGLALEMHGANISGSGARPSGVLQTDKKLGKDTAERLKERWEQLHKGVANSGNTAVLEEGLKWQALTMTSVDMEFIESRKFQLEEICRIFRVSPAKLGVIDGVGRSFELVQLAHLTDTIHPNIRRWEEKLRVFFDIPDELSIEFDVTEMVRADLTARANAARVLIMSGVMSPNDGSSSFGIDEVEGGDIRLVPANMAIMTKDGLVTANGDASAGIGSDQSGAPADGGDGDAASEISAEIAALAPLQPAQPVIINLTVAGKGPSTKRIETYRDADGNLRGRIIEEEGE